MFANVLLIGALIGLEMLPLGIESFETILKEKFPATFDANMNAFKIGMGFTVQ